MQSRGQSLDRMRQLQCYQLYQENAYAYACVDFLSSKLVENGIVVTRGKRDATPEFQAIVDRYYQKFAGDCLVSILLYGFVAWETQMVDQFRIPVVLPGTHITVEVGHDKEKALPSYEGIYTITNQKCTYFSMVYAPDLVHMVIDSPLCKVLPYHIFEVSLLQNAARADRRNADTPLVLENTAENAGFWAMKGLDKHGDDLGALTGASATFSDIGNELGCTVKSRMECVDETLVRMQENYVKHLNTIGELDAMQQSKLYQKTKQETLPRMQLPPHTRVQGVSFPSTRNDLKDLIRMNSQRICVACGVPPEILIKDHHVKHDQSQSMNTVIQRITELRKIIQPLLTNALLECTKGDDFVMGILTGDTAFAIEPTIVIQPQLPPTEELVKLHQQQLLPTSYLREHLSKKYGFDINRYEDSVPPAKAAKVSEEDGPGRADGRADIEAPGAAEEQ